MLVLPAVVVVLTLFGGGFSQGLLRSLKHAETGRWTAMYYQRLIVDTEFWDALGLTLKISSLTALLSGFFSMCIMAGLFYMLVGSGRHKAIKYRRLLHIPMLFPYVVAAYAATLLFQQSGLLSRLAYHVGWIQDIQSFPVLINDVFGWGIIIAYVWKTVPFMVLMMFPILMGVQEGWYQTAQTLGASRFKFFIHVVVPLLEQTWLVAVFIVFAFTFSAFEIPYLLGVTYPKTLSVMAHHLYTNGELGDRPIAMAINALLTLITLTLGYISYKLYQQRKVGS